MPVIPVEFEIVDAFTKLNLDIWRQAHQRLVVNPALVVYRLSDSDLGDFGKIQMRKVNAASCALEYFHFPRFSEAEAIAFLFEFAVQCRLEYLASRLAADPALDVVQLSEESQTQADFDLRRKFPGIEIPADPPGAQAENGLSAARIQAVQKYVYENGRARMQQVTRRHYLALVAEHGLEPRGADGLAQAARPPGRRGGPIPTDPKQIEHILQAWERERGRLSQEAFCRRYAIAPSTLRAWKRKEAVHRK